MTVKELKLSKGYEFECNMSNEYNNEYGCDEWGCAFIWLGDDIGVEYNFCIQDNGDNCCAIYKSEINSEGYLTTDYDKYAHYEINFNNLNWIEELENAMCKAMIEFHNL